MQTPKVITREKHLDHMVKVVPFIVAAYGLQCYIIMQMSTLSFSSNGLLFMGLCLVLMIGAFITYDLKHKVALYEDHIDASINIFNYRKQIFYQDISTVQVSEKNQTFASLIIKTHQGKKITFHFVDDADKIKQWLDQKCFTNLKAAA
jgi:hypothetical protein